MAILSVQSQENARAMVNPPPPPPQNSIPATGFSANSLYVGDLDASVDEDQLCALFNRAAKVVSVRVCNKEKMRPSLSYAYVNFTNQQDAAKARAMLNFTPIKGKPMRVMFSHRDPTLRKSGYANLFIKNLDASIDHKVLHDKFATFGTILSCKVALDSNGKSKGYGFVQFDQEEAAQKAIQELNGKLMNDKKLYVDIFVPRRDRKRPAKKFTNVYVKNFPETTTDEDLRTVFGKYGSITSAVVVKDENGASKSFGFVNFEKPEEAVAAIVNMNGTSLGDKALYVGKAQKKAERKAQLKAKYEAATTKRIQTTGRRP